MIAITWLRPTLTCGMPLTRRVRMLVFLICFATPYFRIHLLGRPMYYSIHGPSGAEAVPLANCWRTTGTEGADSLRCLRQGATLLLLGDINNDWGKIMDRIHTNDGFSTVAKPGAFNDPDMLEVNITLQLVPSSLTPRLGWQCSPDHGRKSSPLQPVVPGQSPVARWH